MIVFFLMTRISVNLMNEMIRNVTINQYPQIKVENKIILVLGMTRAFWMIQAMNMRLQKHRWTKKHAHLTRGHWWQIRSLSKQFLVDLFQEIMQLVFSRKSSVCNKKNLTALSPIQVLGVLSKKLVNSEYCTISYTENINSLNMSDLSVSKEIEL